VADSLEPFYGSHETRISKSDSGCRSSHFRQLEY
jgi:hypothetical protein